MASGGVDAARLRDLTAEVDAAASALRGPAAQRMAAAINGLRELAGDTPVDLPEHLQPPTTEGGEPGLTG